MAMSFSGTAGQSPYRQPVTVSPFIPWHDPNTPIKVPSPQRTASPSRQTAKKSKLGISTSSLQLGSSMNRSASGIALASNTPLRHSRTGTTPLDHARIAFPHMNASMHASMNGHSRVLPPNSFMSTTGSLQDQMRMSQSIAIDPNEAKSLYFAHYNGLEVHI